MIELDPITGRILLREHDANECLILYGSHARGDFTAASDVDVLRVANTRALRESIEESITLHTYTLDDLLLMARQGSLFVLHLLREGRPLNDPSGVMPTLRAAFCRPDSYLQAARERLGCAIRLLDIDDSLFATAPREFVAQLSSCVAHSCTPRTRTREPSHFRCEPSLCATILHPYCWP